MDAVNRSLATLPDRVDDRRTNMARGPDASTRGRVLVVDEHDLFATGLQLALADRCWDVEPNSGPTAVDVLAHARRFEPHCVLLDVRLGDGIGSGIDLIGPLVATGAQVVMLTAERRRPILAECLQAGAAGFIGKAVALDEVDASLGHLFAGDTIIGRSVRAALLDELRRERDREAQARKKFERLTPREALVLAALTDGLNADEIARDHVVSLATVRSQIRAVLQKLGVRSQLAAVAVANSHYELLPCHGTSRQNRRQTPAPGSTRQAGVSVNIA